ncbi:MAG: hypothetical protein JWM46_256 [Candidatus Kaiserbacteria bacterium]|nr:hypothetical protein [Candidatus Kaiserbacteria bacterium]
MRSKLVTLAFIIASIVPLSASAQINAQSLGLGLGLGLAAPTIINSLTSSMTTAADLMCTPYFQQCPCNMVPGPKGCVGGKNTANCQPGVCFDTTNGSKTLGTCTAQNKCKGVSTSGAGGGASSGLGLDKIAGILGQLMGQLMQGSSAPAPTAATPAATGSGSCTSTYIVHVVSSDPCAIYVPTALSGDTSGLTNSNNVTSDLLNALNGGTSVTTGLGNDTTVTGSSSTDILNQYSNNTGTAVVTGQSSSSTINPVGNNVFAQSANIAPGVRGDIAVLSSGATFVIGNRDQANNTEVAGFYGGDTTLGAQPTGLVASWCQSRPWSTNFLSKIITPSFFDGLCTLRGYKVGDTAVSAPATGGQTTVTITQSPTQPVKANTTIASSSAAVGSVPPTVDIWASPKTVSLGARTSIFWTSSGAQSCAVTSPDGSFSQHTLTGGASTVAITSATVFTISCVSVDGAHATKDVTVQIAI